MRAVGRAAILVSLVLAGTAVLAATYFVWSSRPKTGDHPIAELVAAVGSSLPFEARLTGGFAPSEDPAVLRSGDAATTRLSPDTRIAIAQLEKRAAADPSADALSALGVAYLVQGDVDRSISTLQDAASMGVAASPWSDLSAAYLVKAERVPTRRIEYLSRALEAAAQSLKRAPSAEALFNRALAIDGLAPFVGETQPWSEYLGAERDPRWVEVAKRHVRDKQPVDDVRKVWEGRQRELRERLTKLDRGFVEETVRLFPEASIEFFEQELLVGWAKAMLRNDASTVRRTIEQATLLGAAIRDVTNDPMARDEAAAMPSAGAELARAHLAYAEGVEHYGNDDYPTAMRSFVQALEGYSQAPSPYRHWAVAQLATILFQRRELADADRRLNTVEAVARAEGYQTLLGRILWLRGLVFSKQWRLTEALDAFRDALSCFEALGERENVASINSHLADTLRTLGDQQQSWQYIARTLEGLPQVRRPIRRYLFLYNASLFASSQQLYEAALLFQDATVREASKASDLVRVEALTQRSVVHLRRGDLPEAMRDLEAASSALAPVADSPLTNYLRVEIGIVTAELDHARRQAGAVDSLKRAITFFERAEPARVPRLYLNLARTHLAAQGPAAAEAALAVGIARLETQQSRLDDEALQISYFDEAWELFPEMVSLQHRVRHDPVKTFEYAERARARSLLAQARGLAESRPSTIAEVQRLLPPSVVLVYYVTLPDRLLVWAITSVSSMLVESSVSEKDLARLVTQHRAALLEGRDTSASNDRLFNLLIRPISSALSADSTIVLAPDGQLQQLAFATLRDPARQRYLIENHPILVTPSASFLAASVAKAGHSRRRRIDSALLIGNPTTEAALLPGAEAEVTRAAQYYSNHEVLVGRTATKTQFVEKAPDYEVIHFGGHAFANAEYPLLSRLSFAAGREGEQPLFAHEISRLRFDKTRLVVLAACSTGAGTVSRGEGVMSVARPFLGAGVPVVVASQWDVDDRATSELFREFHRALVGTQNPLTALRAAQITLLHSQNSLLASPASWGAFVAFGGTAQ